MNTKNHTTLQNIDHATASISELWAVATPTMGEAAESQATAAMARISDPVAGAREIVIAGQLRQALAAERKSVGKFFAALSMHAGEMLT